MAVGFYQLHATYPEACDKLLKAGYKSLYAPDAQIYTRFGEVQHLSATAVKRFTEPDEGERNIVVYSIRAVIVKHPDIVTSVNFFAEFQFSKKNHSMFEHAQRIENLDIEYAERLIARIYETVKTQ